MLHRPATPAEGPPVPVTVLTVLDSLLRVPASALFRTPRGITTGQAGAGGGEGGVAGRMTNQAKPIRTLGNEQDQQSSVGTERTHDEHIVRRGVRRGAPDG